MSIIIGIIREGAGAVTHPRRLLSTGPRLPARSAGRMGDLLLERNMVGIGGDYLLARKKAVRALALTLVTQEREVGSSMFSDFGIVHDVLVGDQRVAADDATKAASLPYLPLHFVEDCGSVCH